MRKTQAAKQGNEFPQRLRQLRVQNNFSQAEIGQLSGINKIDISRYERGVSRPSADKLKKLADSLGVSSDFLLGGSENNAAVAHFEDRELLKMFQEVAKLPDNDKNVIKSLIDAYLAKKKIHEMTAK